MSKNDQQKSKHDSIREIDEFFSNPDISYKYKELFEMLLLVIFKQFCDDPEGLYNYIKKKLDSIKLNKEV